MAWNETKNEHFFRRIERAAARLLAALEACRRLKDQEAVFRSDITDQASGDHTKAELVDFRDNVIDPLLALFHDEAVPAQNRIENLQEWVANAE